MRQKATHIAILISALFLLGSLPLMGPDSAEEDIDNVSEIKISHTSDNSDIVCCWMSSGENLNGGNVEDVVIDSNGNIYIIGGISGGEIFIAKLNSEGSWLWVRTIEGSNTYQSKNIEVDHNDQIIITGNGGPDLYFDQNNSISVTGSFIAKIDELGNWIWVSEIEHMNPSGHSEIMSLTVDDFGNPVLTGITNNDLTFGSNTLQVQGDLYHSYVAKLDDSGSWLWVKSVQSAENVHTGVISESIITDSQQNIYVSGRFDGEVNFDDSLQSLFSTGSDSDFFFAKLSPSGDWIWIKQVETTEGAWSSTLSIDSQDIIYMSGSTTGHLKFGTTHLTNFDNTFFISKSDKNGSWIDVTIGIDIRGETHNYIRVHSSVADTDGNIHVTGIFTGNQLGTNNQQLNSHDGGMFWGIINPDLTWKQINGFKSSSSISASSIDVDNSGNVVITGVHWDAVKYGQTIYPLNGGYILTFHDYDDDGIEDSSDNCNNIILDIWKSNLSIDYDGDGCRDLDQDKDDDNDGINDTNDLCPFSMSSFRESNLFYLWDYERNSTTDYDDDGCIDQYEDLDDDNDGFSDDVDDCPLGVIGIGNDHDADGCQDSEDSDDDNDGFSDDVDECPLGVIGIGNDHDADGCQDSEDSDDDNDLVPDTEDNCSKGELSWLQNSTTDFDADGCHDYIEDDDDDNDGVNDLNDSFPLNNLEWNDLDSDGYGDNSDDCIGNYGTSTIDRLGCIDQDSDGISDLNDEFPFDANETMDSDGDGVGDNSDAFPNDANETMNTDKDGVENNSDAFPNDANETMNTDKDGVENNSDAISSNEGYQSVTDLLFNVILVLVSLGIAFVTILKVVSKLRSDDEDWDDEDFDYYEAKSETRKKSPKREYIHPSIQSQQTFVNTWEELPEGEWLDNDEQGTHWYLDNDGNHWHSTDDGYAMYNKSD